jgi:hypothetical protein
MAPILAEQGEVPEVAGVAEHAVEQLGGGNAIAQQNRVPEHVDGALQAFRFGVVRQIDVAQRGPVRLPRLTRDVEQRIVAQAGERTPQPSDQCGIVGRIARGTRRRC